MILSLRWEPESAWQTGRMGRRERRGGFADAMPGDQWNGLQVRFDQCNALNKPLFIGEAGIKSNCSDPDCYTQQQRAELFNAKMAAFYNAGGVGYAVWSYRDWNGIDPPWTFDAADPLAQVIAQY